MNRSELRELVMLRDRHRCIWPKCGQPAVELSHFHSIGAGGRRSADTLDNAGAMCRVHARLSDGESVAGVDYGKQHFHLLGPAYWDMPAHFVAWERANALRLIAVSANVG